MQYGPNVGQGVAAFRHYFRKRHTDLKPCLQVGDLLGAGGARNDMGLSRIEDEVGDVIDLVLVAGENGV
jgi:hypothetical protein